MDKSGGNSNKNLKTVLISPVHQTPEVLGPVLRSWSALLGSGVDRIVLVDDKSPAPARELMDNYQTEFGRDKIAVIESGIDGHIHYSKSDVTHSWGPDALDRITVLRNRILGILADVGERYSYALISDSDLVIRPDVVIELIDHAQALTPRSLISPIFWTRWMPDDPLMPQVWDQHPYGYDGIIRRRIDELKERKLHKVNGLGACTLIPLWLLRSEGVLGMMYGSGRGSNRTGLYSPVPGMEKLFNKLEDRSFCVRMSCFGFGLYGLGVGRWDEARRVEVDPGVFHVYRSTDVERAWELVKGWEGREVETNGA